MVLCMISIWRQRNTTEFCSRSQKTCLNITFNKSLIHKELRLLAFIHWESIIAHLIHNMEDVIDL